MTTNFDRAKTHFDSALRYINLSDFESAENELIAANILCPGRISILVNLSFILVNLQKWDKNLDICTEILKIDDSNLDGLVHLSISLHQLGRDELAYEHISRVLKIHPNSHAAWSNYGNIALDNKDYIQAQKCFEKSLSLNSQSQESYIGLGNLFNEQAKYKMAIDCYDFALSINPSNHQALWNKSLSLLRLGDFDSGWKLYESRWHIPGMMQGKKKLSTRLWLGDFSIRGQVIHIYSEQGYGDVIQMARFLPILESKFGAQVIFETSAPLFQLMKSLSTNITVIRNNDRPFSKNGLTPSLHCPIMSLPFAFKTQIHSIPQQTPYLFANTSKTQTWAERLHKFPQSNIEKKQFFRIGLCTHGSGHYAGKPSTKRDLPWNVVSEILSKCNQLPIEWHSLNVTNNPVVSLIPDFIDHSKCLIDFDETAALIMNLDLIISVDTAVAHLAGALGKSVLVLLPSPPDFLSGIAGTKSLWYSNMEYLRQPEPNVWPIESLINKISLLCSAYQPTKNHP